MRMEQSTEQEYASSAQAAGLYYVTDEMPGIRRRRHGRGFAYVDADGRPIRDAAMLTRSSASANSSSPRRGATCGSVPIRTDTSRSRRAMRAGASSIGIIPGFASSGTGSSSSG